MRVTVMVLFLAGSVARFNPVRGQCTQPPELAQRLCPNPRALDCSVRIWRFWLDLAGAAQCGRSEAIHTKSEAVAKASRLGSVADS